MRLDNILYDDNPLKSVRQVHQGFLLLLAFFGGRYFKGGLNVESWLPLFGHLRLSLMLVVVILLV